ncbi:hypothetical protein Tco_1418615 [Tanacetum coccineum]
MYSASVLDMVVVSSAVYYEVAPQVVFRCVVIFLGVLHHASRFRWMIYLMVLADAAESDSDAIRFEYFLSSSSGWTNIRCAPFEALYGRKCRSPVIWAEIRGSSLIRPERKPLEFEADASLYVPLDEIKVDKTFRFVKEPVENSDREVKRLKCSRMVVVKFLFDELRDRVVNDVVTQLKAKLLAVRYLMKVSWNSKGNFELTWQLIESLFWDIVVCRKPMILAQLYVDILSIIFSSLIPLSHGSFDVLVGMDRLSKRKFRIVCHGKVLRIPLEGDEILRVHGERTQGVVKTLMNTKTKVSYDLIIFREEHECHLLRRGAWSSFEVRVGITKEGEVYGVKRRIMAAQSEAFKQSGSTRRKALWGMMRTVVMDEAHASRLRWMIYLVVLADAAESVRDTIGFEYCLASSSGWTKSPVLWAEIGESSLTGPELVLDMTDKVVLIKEKLKAARDRQKSYADNRRKPLEFEVGDRVMLKVSPWKGVIRFGKKGKLAPRYVGPFEILERVDPVAYRLRLLKELSGAYPVLRLPEELSGSTWTRIRIGTVLEWSLIFFGSTCACKWPLGIHDVKQLIKSLFWDIVVCPKPMILAQLYVDVLSMIFRSKAHMVFYRDEDVSGNDFGCNKLCQVLRQDFRGYFSETSKVGIASKKAGGPWTRQMEKRADDGKANVYGVRGMILAAQSEAFKQENVCAERSPVLWTEIGESSLTGPELVLDMIDKVVLIKEKLKAVRDRQKSYADNRRKLLEFEVGDRVMLKVSPWKGVIRFGKKGKLAPSLHVPLDEIKVDKTLRFVEEPVENSDREVKRLKCSRMVVVKVHLGSKRGL